MDNKIALQDVKAQVQQVLTLIENKILINDKQVVVKPAPAKSTAKSKTFTFHNWYSTTFH
jgi:hypothetical protein